MKFILWGDRDAKILGAVAVLTITAALMLWAFAALDAAREPWRAGLAERAVTALERMAAAEEKH